MLNLVLFGPPGAGKGTQSQKLMEKYQLVHISTGDIFRAHIQGKTDLGKQVSQIIADGNLVPDLITIALLEVEIQNYPNTMSFTYDNNSLTILMKATHD